MSPFPLTCKITKNAIIHIDNSGHRVKGLLLSPLLPSLVVSIEIQQHQNLYFSLSKWHKDRSHETEKEKGREGWAHYCSFTGTWISCSRSSFVMAASKACQNIDADSVRLDQVFSISISFQLSSFNIYQYFYMVITNYRTYTVQIHLYISGVSVDVTTLLMQALLKSNSQRSDITWNSTDHLKYDFISTYSHTLTFPRM